ncbi:hypothetical protein AMECASPLE_006948, partial [Ameca splendens]
EGLSSPAEPSSLWLEERFPLLSLSGFLSCLRVPNKVAGDISYPSPCMRNRSRSCGVCAAIALGWDACWTQTACAEGGAKVWRLENGAAFSL